MNILNRAGVNGNSVPNSCGNLALTICSGPRVVHFLCLLGLVWSLWGGAGIAWSEHENVENQLKVAFLINFAKFTSWPPEAFVDVKDSFLLCVDKDDPFNGALEVLAHKQIGGRNIKLSYTLNRGKDKQPCHLLYLSRSKADKNAQVLQSIAGKPVLTVSDTPGFAQAGGVIELRKKGDRFAFVVNNLAAQAAGLRLNSSFLQLAFEVL